MKPFSTKVTVFTLFLISSLVLSSLSCDRRKEKTFSIAFMEIWADSLKYVLMDICKQWAAENQVKLLSEHGEEWKLADVDVKAADFVQGQNVPNIAMFPNHLAVVYQNHLRDFSPVMDEISRDYPGVQPVSRAMLFERGRWIGVPVFSWSHLMVLRKDILDRIGEGIPQTFDDLARVAKKMNDPKNDFIGFGIGLGKDDDFAMFFQSILWSFGGSVFDKDGKQVMFDRLATRSAVQYIMDLHRAGVLPPGALQWGGADNNKAFLAGRTGLTFNAPTIYYVALRRDTAMARKIVHALYPANDRGDRHAYVTGFCFVSRKDNENKPLVDSFLQFLFRPQNYTRLIEAGGGSINPSFRGLEQMPIWEDPNLRVALESMQYEHPVGWPGPVTRAAADVFRQRVITKMFARIINDKLSIDDAIKEATAEIREKL